MNEVLWIKSNPPVELAIVLRPRGGNALKEELLRIKQAGVQTLVSLLEPDEAEWLGLAEEGPLAEESGFRFLNYPIPDTEVPSDTRDFRKFVSGLADRLCKGESIGVHCQGSIGRSTVTAACTLIHLGLKPLDAVAAVEAARGRRVPDTDEQLRWIQRYKANP